jgi:hypothetical protein
MKPNLKLLTALAVIAVIPLRTFCQTKNIACADIKTGIFYYYPKNSTDSYIETRDDDYLYEKNIVKGDSSVWKIEWKSDCEYWLKYVSGNTKMTDEVVKLLEKHKLVYQVNKVTNDYYTFTGYIDKTSNQPIQTDTIWYTQKVNVPNNKLLARVTNPATLKWQHFSDTSKYAVLYVYRPGKFSNSRGDYLVYFDENIMCIAKNNSGYIFKVLKEGTFEIKSRLFKDESSVKLEVKFGNTYYVKSMIHWTISKRLYNFKLDMQVMTPQDGQTEFANVDLQ